jgi:hypothetical protein
MLIPQAFVFNEKVSRPDTEGKRQMNRGVFNSQNKHMFCHERRLPFSTQKLLRWRRQETTASKWNEGERGS